MSYSIYVGAGLSVDGSGYLAGYGDEPSSHWLEIIPAATYAPGDTVEVGVTAAAEMPGQITRIPQVPVTARHVRVSYTCYRGNPPPLTNGGLNEHGVAVRTVWSPSRKELVAMTPADQTGPTYSDLAKLVLERARTAREGVELIGALIDRHGHSSYGGNSHMIADAEEGWVVIEFAGGLGLWVAERLGPDDLRISRPGSIGEMPVPPVDNGRFLHSRNFVDFAVSQGWYDPVDGRPFDVNGIYGEGAPDWEGIRWIEAELRDRIRQNSGLRLEDVFWALRTERLTGDSAAYGQVVPLAGPKAAELRMLWHAHVGPVAAPFVPVFLGVADVPDEFRRHRYLSSGEAEAFYGADRIDAPLPAVPQNVEATRSATAVHKRLYYLMMQDPAGTLDDVHAVWRAIEHRLMAQADRISRIGQRLVEAGEEDLLAHHLTYFTGNELLASLNTAASLAEGLDVRLRALGSLKKPPFSLAPELLW